METLRRQHISGMQVDPLLLPPPLNLVRHFTCDASRYLRVKAVEGAPGGVGDTPRLAAVEEDGGDHGLVEHAHHLGRDLLLDDIFGDPPPNLTCALEVTPGGWRVAVVPGDDPS